MSLLARVLKQLSGNSTYSVSDQLLFDKIIGFRGVVPGVGTSTVVQNTAIALSELTNYNICVVDTAFLYPTMFPMLNNKKEEKRLDLLDFNGDLADVVSKTNYPTISLFSMSHRNITDMLSTSDSELIIEKLFGVLKSYFDIVLVDLTYEPTNIATHAAVKCNRIVNVADQSLKSVYHLRKSVNTMATLAVPVAKANIVVVNKILPDVITNTQAVLKGVGMDVVAEIPFSLEIAKMGVTGSPIYSKRTSSQDIHAFSSAIISIIETILPVTPNIEKRIKNRANVAEVAVTVETPPVQDTAKPITKVTNSESKTGDRIAVEDDLNSSIDLFATEPDLDSPQEEPKPSVGSASSVPVLSDESVAEVKPQQQGNVDLLDIDEMSDVEVTDSDIENTDIKR